MSEANTILCRLCKNTNHLTNLYEDDGDISLDMKVSFTIDLKISPEDGLPAFICKQCKQKVKKFFQFKQKCYKVYLDLREISQREIIRNNNEITNLNNISNCDASKYCDIISDTELNGLLHNDNSCVQENEKDPNFIQCEHCGSMFTTKIEYRRHLSSHSESKLECKFCLKRFTRVESSLNHMRSHLGIRPFICEICGQSSTKRQDLIRHMKIHSDERNHECDTCGRRFKRSSDLCSHLRIHSGARPFKCTLCDKDYTSHSGLRKHSKTHYSKESKT